MNKLIVKTASLLLLLPGISMASPILPGVNFKNEYCGNKEYLGNEGAKAPHLHCGKSFIAYKKANGDHLNMAEHGNCVRTDLVFDDIKANKEKFANYAEIYNALVAFHQADCPNQ